MTGKEFLNRVRNIKQITGIKWEIEGDPWEADIVRVKVTADGEQLSILLGHPKTTIDIEPEQEISIRLIINKLLEQNGIHRVSDPASDLVSDINFTIQLMKGGKNNDR